MIFILNLNLACLNLLESSIFDIDIIIDLIGVLLLSQFFFLDL